MEPGDGDWVRVCDASDVGDGKRVLARVDGTEIGVFAHRGNVRAYENRCPHQGGPVCRGKILARLDEDDTGARTSQREDTADIACPWHGWEYDLADGRHIGNPAVRLRSFPVATDGASVFVRVAQA